MKNNILVILIMSSLLFLGCSKNKKEIVITYDDGNPQKIEYCHYQGNKRVVERVVYYYDNGKKESEFELLDGKKSGKQVFYFINGGEKLVERYENGKLNGKSVQYYVSGEISYEASWKNNLPHGEWIYYNDNGEVKSKQTFENGKLIK
jgi:antitoxin component YwqK of YwqJK toxin-antitoxin module